MAIANLADRLGIDRGGVHHCVNELARRGFIYRTHARDGRESWKIRPFPLTAQPHGYALVPSGAVHRITSARHYRAYALACRESKRAGGEVTARRIARSLVNMGTSGGRDRALPKPCSPDTASRTLADLVEAGWLLIDRAASRPGLPVVYDPQWDGEHDVTRDFRSAARRAEREAARLRRRTAPAPVPSSSPAPADEPDEGTGGAGRDERPRDDRDGPQASQTSRGRPHEAPPGPACDQPLPPATDDDGTREETLGEARDDPRDDSSDQGRDAAAPGVRDGGSGAVHSPPQPGSTMTSGSQGSPVQPRDGGAPQGQDAGPRNRAAQESLARRASDEHLMQPPVVRNGAQADARGPDDLGDQRRPGGDHGSDRDDHGSGGGRGRGPSAVDPVWRDDSDGGPDLSGLRGRLSQVRQSGPATRPGRLRPQGERDAVRDAVRETELEHAAAAETGEGPGGLSGLRAALGRSQRRGPGSWGRYAAPEGTTPRAVPRGAGPAAPPPRADRGAA